MSKKQDEPKQKTIHGHEIPIPKRQNFLRDLNKLVKPKSRKKSRRPRRPTK